MDQIQKYNGSFDREFNLLQFYTKKLGTYYINYRYKNRLKPCFFLLFELKKLKKGYFKLFII